MTTSAGTLRETIDKKAVMAKTKRLDLSFNELMSMYEDEELEIQPAFQRIFVWDNIKQSQFIESLLLELPVPPIYVVEIEEGHYVLVDGLQRLSTYFHFRGVLNNDFKGIRAGTYLQLVGCDIANELNGKAWDNLDTALQVRLKRAFVSVQVIRRESDPNLKFHMFKRLNDGGTPISPQQVRNCVVRMLEHGPTILDFIERLANETSYKECCTEALTDEQINSQFDRELILRFFALKNNRANFEHDVGTFIDAFTEGIAQRDQDSKLPFDLNLEEAVFKKTFQVLAASTVDQSFTFPNKSGSDLTRGFSTNHFEAVTIGLQSRLAALNPSDPNQMQRLRDALREVRLSAPFKLVTSGGGKNSPGPLNTRIQLVETAIANI